MSPPPTLNVRTDQYDETEGAISYVVFVNNEEAGRVHHVRKGLSKDPRFKDASLTFPLHTEIGRFRPTNYGSWGMAIGKIVECWLDKKK